MQVGDCRTVLHTDLLPEVAGALGCSVNDLFQTETPGSLVMRDSLRLGPDCTSVAVIIVPCC